MRQGEKSVLIWEYRVCGGGHLQLDGIAEPVDRVLARQLDTLAEHLPGGEASSCGN